MPRRRVTFRRAHHPFSVRLSPAAPALSESIRVLVEPARPQPGHGCPHVEALACRDSPPTHNTFLLFWPWPRALDSIIPAHHCSGSGAGLPLGLAVRTRWSRLARKVMVTTALAPTATTRLLLDARPFECSQANPSRMLLGNHPRHADPTSDPCGCQSMLLGQGAQNGVHGRTPLAGVTCGPSSTQTELK